MTTVLEMGLIHPSVGLNIFVIANFAPDTPRKDVVLGSGPFVILMALAILLHRRRPGIATRLPELVMGRAVAR